MIQLHEQTAYSLHARGSPGVVERDSATEGKITGGHKIPGFFGVFEYQIGHVKEAFEPIQAVGFIEVEAAGHLTSVQGSCRKAHDLSETVFTDTQALDEMRLYDAVTNQLSPYDRKLHLCPHCSPVWRPMIVERGETHG
jgi:hypothetical protein